MQLEDEIKQELEKLLINTIYPSWQKSEVKEIVELIDRLIRRRISNLSEKVEYKKIVPWESWIVGQ